MYFSPTRVRNWVEEVSTRKQPKFTLEFDDARVTFADGWNPGLAVEFEGLVLRARDRCLTGSEVRIERINLPVRASALFSQKVRFGRIAAENIEVRLADPLCDSKLEIPEEVEGKTQSPLVTRLEDFVRRRWRREIENTTKILDSVEVDKVAIFAKEAQQPALKFLDLQVELLPESGAAKFQFMLEAGDGLVSEQISGKLRSHLVVSEESAVFTGRGNIKEGQYEGAWEWDVASGFWKSHLEMRDVPASKLLTLMGHWGFLAWPDFQPRNQWFRCHLRSEGSLGSWQSAGVRFEACSFYGDIGDVLVRPGEVNLFKGELYPVTADFRSVDMRLITQYFDNLRSWVLRPGRASGVFTILSPQQLKFDGEWFSPQVSLPYGSWVGIDRLVVDQAKLNWNFDSENSQLDFSEPVIMGQETPLKVSLMESVSDRDSLRVSWKLDWDFWPRSLGSIRDTLKASDLQSEGEVFAGSNDWTLKLSASSGSANLAGYDLKEATVKLSYKKSTGNLTWSADSVTSDTSKTAESLFREVYEKALQGSADSLEDLRVKMEFDKEGRWVANPIQFKWGSGRGEFLGRGYQWSVDQGLLKIRRFAGPSENFEVFGSLKEPRFESVQE